MADEQQGKAAVEAMRHAKATMTAVLERNRVLETALDNARASIVTLKGYIAPNAYTYPIQGQARKCTDDADAALAAIVKVQAA